MLRIFLATATAIISASAVYAAELGQPDYDRDAAKVAQRAKGVDWSKHKSTITPDQSMPATRWHVVTAEEIRSNSGYFAPAGYVFHTSASTDLDGDGRVDTVELVDNGNQGAVRIRFGNPSKPEYLLMRGDRLLAGQGVFAAGRAVMINYPESRVAFVFMTAGKVRVSFVGD